MNRVLSRALLGGLLLLAAGAVVYTSWDRLRPAARITRLQQEARAPLPDLHSEDEHDNGPQSRSRHNRVEAEARNRRSEGHDSR